MLTVCFFWNKRKCARIPRKIILKICAREMIEVEKHFRIDAETRPKLTELGAKLTSREEFTDVYYDTAECKLMTSAHYLRQRDGTWQLKHAVVMDRESPHHGGAAPLDSVHSRTECNYEIENDPAIITQLRNVVTIDDETILLSQLVEKQVLLPVAEFSTQREGWAWPDKKMGDHVSIELDEASFDYSIGSVEVIVGVAEEVPAAESIARDIAGKIGKFFCLHI